MNAKNGPATYEVIWERVKMICKLCTLHYNCTKVRHIRFYLVMNILSFLNSQKVSVYWLLSPSIYCHKLQWRNEETLASHQGLCVCVCVCVWGACDYVHTHKNIITTFTKTSVSVHKYKKYDFFFFLWFVICMLRITTYKFLYKGKRSSSCFRLSIWWKSEKTFQVWSISTQRILREHKHISYPGKH